MKADLYIPLLSRRGLFTLPCQMQNKSPLILLSTMRAPLHLKGLHLQRDVARFGSYLKEQ